MRGYIGCSCLLHMAREKLQNFPAKGEDHRGDYKKNIIQEINFRSSMTHR